MQRGTISVTSVLIFQSRTDDGNEMNFPSIPEQARAKNNTRLQSAYLLAVKTLLDAREKSGHWVGELSSSALSTATAVCAFAVSNRNAASPDPKHLELIEAGLN